MFNKFNVDVLQEKPYWPTKEGASLVSAGIRIECVQITPNADLSVTEYGLSLTKGRVRK